MNFNQLSRLSPFIRVASRQIARSKTLNNASVKLIPIRCLASESGKTISLKSYEEEVTKSKEEHGKEDWGNFISVSWKLGAILTVGIAGLVFLCVGRSMFMVIEFDTRKIALEEPKDLNIDND